MVWALLHPLAPTSPRGGQTPAPGPLQPCSLPTRQIGTSPAPRPHPRADQNQLWEALGSSASCPGIQPPSVIQWVSWCWPIWDTLEPVPAILGTGSSYQEAKTTSISPSAVTTRPRTRSDRLWASSGTGSSRALQPAAPWPGPANKYPAGSTRHGLATNWAKGQPRLSDHGRSWSTTQKDPRTPHRGTPRAHSTNDQRGGSCGDTQCISYKRPPLRGQEM